jgi:enoyl-CoA hydratase/carnithine racemase
MLDVTDHGSIRELRLARPPVNALDPGLIAALRGALARALSEGREAVMLSGAPGRFSAGLDVPALLKLDRNAIRDLWTDFFGLLRDLATYPVPVVAALTGHSPAGGTVLAVFADHRVFADGPFLMGLNEVEVGLPVPFVLLRALTFAVGEREAARLAVGGLLLGPEEALRIGLVDEVVPVEEVVPRALAWTRDLLDSPRTAMLATRALARRPLGDAFAGLGATEIEQIVEQWFSPEAQATLRALVARLKKPATT